MYIQCMHVIFLAMDVHMSIQSTFMGAFIITYSAGIFLFTCMNSYVAFHVGRSYTSIITIRTTMWLLSSVPIHMPFYIILSNVILTGNAEEDLAPWGRHMNHKMIILNGFVVNLPCVETYAIAITPGLSYKKVQAVYDISPIHPWPYGTKWG